MQSELPSTTAAKLRLRLQQEIDLVHQERLPGWEAFFLGDPKVKAWMDDLKVRTENSIRDEDAVRFEKELASTIKAWHRLNELVAEAYRKDHPDPELWELRYVKWMRVGFIRFDSPLGDFYLVPRTPSRPPRAKHWYTVDEMLFFLRPEISDLIMLSGKLPGRPEDLESPGPGEKVLHIDATGPTVRTYYELHKSKRPRYG